METKKTTKNFSGWTFYNWTFWGWLETGLKSVALLLGLWVMGANGFSGPWVLPAGLRLWQWSILGILSLGLFMAIINRWQNKEVFSMIFVIFNNIGHWGMFLALWQGVGWTILPYFTLFMLLGDVTKIYFLRRYHYSERNVSPRIFIILTLVFVAGYAFILLLHGLGY